ncbi:Ca(2+)/H(+) antiporter [Nitrospira japonica]|uniref:Ca(2+)/H(+) antiporter n=1 Tax=Nitrospira japonica TaxID=1325564 RepID=A0A1W1I9E5_9BACT|nr:calcium/proton exchanger [Nitrospira japonica]SLM49499.1 Ca(2+)/H(+) antiporter [Nitrospira japonica]
MSLNWLLVFIPLALGLDWYGASPIAIFCVSALAIVPLAGLMGQATEQLSIYVGATIGGLMSASLGNAPELIISGFALKEGLGDIVKASITGSILGNLLFSLGLSMIFGGWGRQRQQFNKTVAGVNGGLLFVAAVGLLIPALFHFATGKEREVSTEIAIVLFFAYIASLVFTLKTHRQLVETEPGQYGPGKEQVEEEEGRWSKGKAIAVLGGVTVLIAIMSEMLVGAIEPASASLGFTPIFAGVIFLALVGNAAEAMNAVRFARNDQMDLSFGIAVGASTQVALFVAPVLVFLGYAVGQPMNLHFTYFEIIAITLTVAVVSRLTSDGECNWMEGVMLVCVYLMFAIGFFFLPA